MQAWVAVIIQLSIISVRFCVLKGAKTQLIGKQIGDHSIKMQNCIVQKVQIKLTIVQLGQGDGTTLDKKGARICELKSFHIWQGT